VTKPAELTPPEGPPRQRFVGKAALVTGAASGIGRVLVDRLCAEGAYVVGLDLGAPDGALSASPNYRHVVADVTDEEQIRSAVETTVSDGRALDLVFPFAGAHRGGLIESMDRANWDFTVGLVLTGVFLTIKSAAPHLVSGGAIVTVGSINGQVPMRGGAAYVSAKAGVQALTRNAALEFSERGIRVNCVTPGLIETPLTERFRSIPEVRQAFDARVPLGRPGRAREVVDPVLFLASDEASYITGATLMIDGGWELATYPDLRGIVQV